MGNTLGGRRSAKVMKINGETFKLRAPARAGPLLESHPGHVLLESEAVKHYGAGAKPLEPQQELKPKRLYFLVQLPKFPEPPKAPPARRVSSGIQMSARDRLESLMLARRSASDLSYARPSPAMSAAEDGGGGGVRLRLRLPKAEVEKLMAESKDGAEITKRIIDLCRSGGAAAEQAAHFREDDGGGSAKHGPKFRQKRVSFLGISEEGISPAAAAS
ncbi:uncharacterized protein At1g66480-like [Andrographis paniculata]|uniref:uncharacterized protein At1g66480-like n=1 Tax=Andrographis paniculata TaxID=175694 RepID=UPI0021E89CCA|nr:uncharacterized protein At1g66480-like [Andrographis paniculata]